MTEYPFKHPIEVRYGDLDPQGHLNNAKYLTYFEQARIFYFKHLDLFAENSSFMDIGIIMADVQLSFHQPILFGMNIQVTVQTTRLGNKSMTVQQSLVDGTNGKILCSGEVVLVSYDYHTGKSIPIPVEWREKISRFEELS